MTELEPVRVPVAVRDAYLPFTPPGGQAALEDSIITVDEYLAAVDKAMTCARDAGLNVLDEPRLATSGRALEWSYRTTASNADLAAAAYQQCYATHQLVIERLWTLPDTEARSDSNVLDEVRRCLVQHGVDPPETERITDYVIAALQAAEHGETEPLECVNRPDL